jgi:uncharacterized protein (TIGR02145 family)
MKNIFRITGIILLILLIHSCKMNENNEPKIEHGSVIDYDGNTYNTTKIGTQWWMTENLKVIHYRDGSAIENITDSSAWAYLTTGAYCWYNNNEATYKANYGALYNWYTIVDSRNLCPSGWHVPNDNEWITLITYLGCEAIAGIKLKEVGDYYWSPSTTMSDNSSDFSALAGGQRINAPVGTFNGSSTPFYYMGRIATWWNTTSTTSEHELEVDANRSGTEKYYFQKNQGYSIRCIKGTI